MCSPLKITSRTESLKITHSPTNTPTHAAIRRGKRSILRVCLCAYFEVCVFMYEVKVCVGAPFEQSLKYLFA